MTDFNQARNSFSIKIHRGKKQSPCQIWRIGPKNVQRSRNKGGAKKYRGPGLFLWVRGWEKKFECVEVFSQFWDVEVVPPPPGGRTAEPRP
jgi:hypothetical protein